MERSWKSLPGPTRYLDGIAVDARQGRSVILCVPKHGPTNLRVDVRSVLCDGWDWRVLTVGGDERRAPIDALFDELLPDYPVAGLRNSAMLLEQDAFFGKFIWLDDMDQASWCRWKRFLTDYSQACRSSGLVGRTVFGVVLTGEMALEPPDEDVCLAVHRWSDVIERIDVELLASMQLRDRPMSDLHRQLAVSTIAQISGWDLELATQLIAAPLEDVFAPRLLLTELALKREWFADVVRTPCWEKGMVGSCSQAAPVHSAVLSVVDPERELERRLWIAQVRVLFPLVEEGRRYVVNALRLVLRVPFESRSGRIEDVRDLEIGHIEQQITWNSVPATDTMRRLVKGLREIRNALAHLEPLQTRDLLRDDFDEAFAPLEAVPS